uniref:Receptor protein serine/threonine kinase n=1 Tax=Mesocestoides corti TaxID=53468 RepID=A0A5K3FNV7_MESCO
MFPVLLLVLLVALVPTVKPDQCLKLLCDPDQSDCQHCENLQPHHLNQWRRYIDALLQNFKDEEGNSIYYKQIREQPFCCKPKAGEFCSIKLINEPKLPPHRLYELGCRGQGDFWNSITCAPGGARCCNATFCNLPTDEEISKLIVEKPKDNTLIVILPILFVLTAFVLIGGWCFWRWRDRTDWRKCKLPVLLY